MLTVTISNEHFIFLSLLLADEYRMLTLSMMSTAAAEARLALQKC